MIAFHSLYLPSTIKIHQSSIINLPKNWMIKAQVRNRLDPRHQAIPDATPLAAYGVGMTIRRRNFLAPSIGTLKRCSPGATPASVTGCQSPAWSVVLHSAP